MLHVILLPLIQQYARECAHNLFTCMVKNPIIAQLHKMLALHIPTTSFKGQPYNTSYKNSPIIQVANNIIHRECNSTLYQQTSWYLQHIVKNKYHTIQNIKVSQSITYNFISCACSCPCLTNKYVPH